MSTWLPFENPKMLQVDLEYSFNEQSNLHVLTARCLTSQVGDLNRFCYLVGTNILWVASPMDDDGVPLYPLSNDEGATRTDKILTSADKRETIEETAKGILADLDEYIRSKKALQELVDAELITITT